MSARCGARGRQTRFRRVQYGRFKPLSGCDMSDSLPDMKSKVLVAMSGGVDSCVTAALLAERGYDVVGITMRLTREEEHQDSVFQPCCSAEMAKDARQVAELFGFPHYTINLVDTFEKQVVGDFLDEYLHGRTPNPCVRCNQRLKYGTLYKKAVELEADYIATGHYVRLAALGDRLCVQRAVHTEKDQSYVMGGLTQRQLARGLFPLGDMTKEETRTKARELGLRAAETPESQDICFVPGKDYKEFVRKRVGEQESGPIVSSSGKVLGTHTGLTNYTIGQRKGLGIGGGPPTLRHPAGHRAEQGGGRARGGVVLRPVYGRGARVGRPRCADGAVRGARSDSLPPRPCAVHGVSRREDLRRRIPRRGTGGDAWAVGDFLRRRRPRAGGGHHQRVHPRGAAGDGGRGDVRGRRVSAS